MHNWTPVTGDTRDKKETCYAYRVPWLRTPLALTARRSFGTHGAPAHRKRQGCLVAGARGAQKSTAVHLVMDHGIGAGSYAKGANKGCVSSNTSGEACLRGDIPSSLPSFGHVSCVSESSLVHSDSAWTTTLQRINTRSPLRLCMDCVLGSGDQLVRYVASITVKSNGGEWMRAHECSARP